MDSSFLIECIKNEIESSNLDFKKDIYDFNNSKEKQNFLVDVLSFANGHSSNDKYIITGVKLKPDGCRDIVGITESKIKDGSDYQSLITDNIEPSIIIDFDILEYNKLKFGIFKINGSNNDKPYLFSKKYGDLEKGFLKIRKGQKNDFITRRDLDTYYNAKFDSKQSSICLRGIDNDDLIEKFIVKKFNNNMDFDKLQEIIMKTYEDINNVFLEKSSNLYRLGSTIELKEEDIKNIKKYALINNIQLDDTFFDIGNISSMNVGMMTCNILGTESEKNKYELINQLEEITGIYNGLKEFYGSINDLFYVELAIENIGKKFDEDIEVEIKIAKEDFVICEDFPVPSNCIIERMLDDEIIDKFFKIKPNNKINSYTPKNFSVNPLKPVPFRMPSIIGNVKPEYEEFIDYYIKYIKNLADYFIHKDEDYYYVKYTQKEIKPNEKIFFPSKLIFVKIPKCIEYEIKTKHNPNIMKGKIENRDI